MVMQNMDELFDPDIPRDLIAANHACVCNLAKAPWAPVDWRVLLSEINLPTYLPSPYRVPEKLRIHPKPTPIPPASPPDTDTPSFEF